MPFCWEHEVSLELGIPVQMICMIPEGDGSISSRLSSLNAARADGYILILIFSNKTDSLQLVKFVYLNCIYIYILIHLIIPYNVPSFLFPFWSFNQLEVP